MNFNFITCLREKKCASYKLFAYWYFIAFFHDEEVKEVWYQSIYYCNVKAWQ